MRWTTISRVLMVVVVWLPLACGAADEDAAVDTVATVDANDSTAPSPCTPPETTTVPDVRPSSTTEQGTTTSSISTNTTAVFDSTSTVFDSTSTVFDSTSTVFDSTTTTPLDPELATLQAGLDSLGYWLGEIDGRLGSKTAHATTAFQKAEGLPRTGELDAATVDRLTVAARPQPRSTGSVLEVDLARQILLVASDGRAEWVFDISTGSAATPTPTGQYEIYNEIDGYRHAPLGTLYRPKYFNGGIALHGYTSVPTQPVSHGCVRLTYAAMDFVWTAGLAPLGSAVSVY